MNVTESDLDGKSLYGDDFQPDQLAGWYADEEHGYLELVANYYEGVDGQGNYDYPYDALNRFHAFKFIANRRFACCVALGCAAGADVEPFAPMVEKFIGIEPAEKWWRPTIGGTPARYIKPNISGDIPLDDASADLATAFAVLHHIPNVSHLVGEFARVLRPGGIFLVREPISWMGDFRRVRPGLTRNERGIPIGWFERAVCNSGFRIVRRRLCVVNGFAMIAKLLGLSRPYATMPFVALDWILSEGLRWNLHYRRDSVVKKMAPGAAFWILERKG